MHMDKAAVIIDYCSTASMSLLFPDAISPPFPLLYRFVEIFFRCHHLSLGVCLVEIDEGIIIMEHIGYLARFSLGSMIDVHAVVA